MRLTHIRMVVIYWLVDGPTPAMGTHHVWS